MLVAFDWIIPFCDWCTKRVLRVTCSAICNSVRDWCVDPAAGLLLDTMMTTRTRAAFDACRVAAQKDDRIAAALTVWVLYYCYSVGEKHIFVEFVVN